MKCHWLVSLASMLSLPLFAVSADKAAEETAAQRGEKALLGRHFNPPTIPLYAYENAWKYWGAAGKTRLS